MSNHRRTPDSSVAMPGSIPMRRTVLKAAAGLGALGLGTILTDARDARAAPGALYCRPLPKR